MPLKSNSPTKYFLICGALCIAGIIGWPFLHSPKSIEPPAQTNSPASLPSTETEKQPSFDELMANASVERGRQLAHTCIECHTFDEDGPNRFGPNMFDIYGAPHAHKNDYVYSDALKSMRDKVWDAQNLNQWLLNPKQYAPGTKMGYPGVSSAQGRADIITYLKTLKSH